MLYISQKCKNDADIRDFLEALNSEFIQRKNIKTNLITQMDNYQTLMRNETDKKLDNILSISQVLIFNKRI